MKNPSFEIYINDRLVTTAGITSEFGVVSVITTWVNSSVDNYKDLKINVGGLDSTDESYLTWHNQQLAIGDEVTIKITDSDNISTPTVNPKTSEEEHLKRKISYFHRLKEELKDHL
ncbi:hypothetical protein [Pedobacter ginsengisoli]|uniref:hypothetical protein n=1 Tax=Pedobacter ginsengisoli TaxID=363852 RepID=UPI0025507C8A|nr:hypothetical protein [Pedobacter ginsengisoli]